METVRRGEPLNFAGRVPKICVPITAGKLPDILAELQAAGCEPADLVEWRLDHFQGEVMPALQVIAQNTALPLLCTLRTKAEGGNADVTKDGYESILAGLIASGLCACVDIELSLGEAAVKRLVKQAKDRGIGTVLSMHDFVKTPGREELISTFLKMHALGAMLPKIAVMPNTPEDVLVLLDAALRAGREIGPLAAISMGNLGKISRVIGGHYGSCLTFSSGKSGSAPGQISTQSLFTLMQTFYHEQGGDAG